MAAFIRPVYRTLSYDAAGADGASRDAQEAAGLAGIDLEIASLLTMSFSVGYFHTDFDDPASQPISGLALNGTANWYPTERLTIIGSVSRATEATQQAGVSARINTTLQVKADYELYQDILVGARASYNRDEFDGISRIDDTYGGGFNLRWLVNRNVSAFADIGVYDRSSTAPAGGFDQHIISVGIRFQI